MFCPKCGSAQSDELKFCKSCGANLLAVRQVMDSREAIEKPDWGQNWVADVVHTQEESKRRKEEIERQRGITPEIKLRYDEIKGRHHGNRRHRDRDLSPYLYAGGYSQRQRHAKLCANS